MRTGTKPGMTPPPPKTLREGLDRNPTAIYGIDDTVAWQDLFARLDRSTAWEIWSGLGPDDQNKWSFYLWHTCGLDTAVQVHGWTYERSIRIKAVTRAEESVKQWTDELLQKENDLTLARIELEAQRKNDLAATNDLRQQLKDEKAHSQQLTWRLHQAEDKIVEYKQYDGLIGWEKMLSYRIAKIVQSMGEDGTGDVAPVVSLVLQNLLGPKDG